MFRIVIIISYLWLDASECGQNEVYEECGTACPVHCPSYNERGIIETGSFACVRKCVPGCFCAAGFVRDLKRSNACVQIETCSPP